MGSLFSARVKKFPNVAALVAEKFTPVKFRITQSHALSTLPCAFSRFSASNNYAAPFQLDDYLLCVEKDNPVITRFDFLFNACLCEPCK